ncbi:helix-turn-helix domain-containing protein [Spirosoma validum]|uniref:Helix-turn-helix transcriptional regulator n=1 Tax=Spirosoma validum TaxID=2771355 RepID=A0A927GFK6_9BACT|nr:AraC family transcriptional regulator [Spirosoma validum]MBD2755891.1 helix-turn-helix transcriptional regulator [Spirosoma validum]
MYLIYHRNSVMDNLAKGQFFGHSRNEMVVNGLTVVQSAYHNLTSCPWHYHENAYFAFTTSGHLLETYKRKDIALSAGSLTYHYSQEPHCNSRYSPYVSALHVDIDERWFDRCDLRHTRPEGLWELQSPDLKIIFARLLAEAKQGGTEQGIGTESLVLTAFSKMLQLREFSDHKPAWQEKIKELLYAHYDETLSLTSIASELQLHPVYLCQQFPKLFQCTLSEYVRKIRIEKATERLMNRDPISLTSLAYACGFSDQSHFIRLFKKHTGLIPLAFRKLVQ